MRLEYDLTLETGIDWAPIINLYLFARRRRENNWGNHVSKEYPMYNIHDFFISFLLRRELPSYQLQAQLLVMEAEFNQNLKYYPQIQQLYRCHIFTTKRPTLTWLFNWNFHPQFGVPSCTPKVTSTKIARKDQYSIDQYAS